MASSGTIQGTRDGNKPYLSIDWVILEQDIPNNRSRIKATLKLHSPYTISYSFTKSGVFQGSNFTHRGASGTGTWNLRSTEFWTSHDSNGAKNITFAGTFNINITFSGSWLGQLSVSGIAWLDSIPRASRLKSFSIKNEFRPNTSNAILLEIERYYSGYAHEVVLKYGDYEVRVWGSIHLPTEITIPSDDVNALLKEMKSVNSGTFTLHINTKDYNQTPVANIGTSERLTTRQNIDDSYIPTISNFTDENVGTTLVKSIGYIQELSNVKTSFTGTPSYGAEIRNTRLWIIDPDGNNVGGVNTNNATFNTLSKHGVYRLNCYVVDTRGRVGSQSRWFTVKPYSPPTYSKFSVERQEKAPQNLDIDYLGSWTSFGGKNNVVVKVDYRRIGDAGWTNQISMTYTTNNTNGIKFNHADSYGSFPDSNTYEFRIVITDSIGSVSVGELNVATSKVLLDFHEDIGVGIGKWHEQGDLDVLDDIYIQNSPILESGSNSNGTWYKFYSGLMVCTKVHYEASISLSKTGNAYRSSNIDLGDWASPFANSPFRLVELYKIQGAYDFYTIATPAPNESATSAGRTQVGNPTSNLGNYAYIKVLGIGRWK